MNRTGGGNWRHWALVLGFLMAALVLGARLFQIQILQHERFRARAESQWRQLVEIPPERGNLYDRQGRPLALTVTLWRVGVATKLADDPRALAAALAEALDGDPDLLARRIQKGRGKHIVVRRRAVLEKADLEALRAFPAVTTEELTARIYPFNGVGAAVIGHFNANGGEKITTGLENGLDAFLAGSPGKAWRLASGLGEDDLGHVVLQEARHGDDLFLTLDAGLQEVCEAQLARWVERCEARGGGVLVADPHTGDVLAAASWPLMADRERPGKDLRVWSNVNFTGHYEPGSVFKIFTAASLLENGAIDTSTVFDCSDGDFGSFRIRNSDGHSYGPLNFMEGFAQSSNIYPARAVASLESEVFYRDLTEFGFGHRTRFPIPGQATGILKHPAEWSGRSKATIAIGQEVAVTPLQLIMAACAVANGGILYAPRVVREIRDREGIPIRKCPPLKLHRVISPSLASLLREAMRRVVEHGTGQGAQLDWIELGGKTGTAQKCLDGHGYAPGKFVASFLGMAPIDQPKLVVLTILDEPAGIRHYAAQSAVPLFRDIVGDIRRCTDWLTDVPAGGGSLRGRPTGPTVTVPDVMYLNATVAEEELRRVKLVPAGGEKSGRVVQQVPGPGARCRPGEVVQLTVASGAHSAKGAGALCPDLRGLSNREVLTVAARLGVPVKVDGIGFVTRQDPPAGQRLGPAGIRVRMAEAWP